MDEADRCYASGVRILKYRFNSATELRRKLRAKGFDRPTIDATIARLSKEKWLDDERFASVYVRSRVLKNKGRQRIRRELIGAGVDDETIAQAVSENVNPDDERERAAAAARRRLPILLRRYEAREARNKLTMYLLKQGYEASLVYDVVAETIQRTANSERREGE